MTETIDYAQVDENLMLLREVKSGQRILSEEEVVGLTQQIINSSLSSAIVELAIVMKQEDIAVVCFHKLYELDNFGPFSNNTNLRSSAFLNLHTELFSPATLAELHSGVSL